jgi:hypothetical protein
MPTLPQLAMADRGGYNTKIIVMCVQPQRTVGPNTRNAPGDR